MNTKDQLIDFALNKLKSFGFINVNKSNLLKDDVYVYHFKKVIDPLKGKDEETDKLITNILKSIPLKKK